jgi:hypothetical protein
MKIANVNNPLVISGNLKSNFLKKCPSLARKNHSHSWWQIQGDAVF